MKNILYIGDSHSVTTMGLNLLNHMETFFDPKYYSINYFAVTDSTFVDWMTSSIHEKIIKNVCKSGTLPLQISCEPVFKNMIELFNELHPYVTVIALGTNDLLKLGLDNDKSKSDYLTLLTKFSKICDNDFCYWLLPPSLDPLSVSEEVQKSYEKLLGKFFKTIKCDRSLRPDQPDQVHFYKQRGLTLSEDVWKKLQDQFKTDFSTS